MAVRRSGFFIAAVAMAVLAGGCGTHHAVSRPSPKPHHPVVSAVSAPSGPSGLTFLAATHGAIPGSPEPGAPENMLVPGNWYGYPSILPVVDSRPNWVEVRLAQRPNDSTSWVPLSDVTLSMTLYRIVVNLSTQHLTVYQSGKAILDFPAGIGTGAVPIVVTNTVTGASSQSGATIFVK